MSDSKKSAIPDFNQEAINRKRKQKKILKSFLTICLGMTLVIVIYLRWSDITKESPPTTTSVTTTTTYPPIVTSTLLT